MKKYSQLYTVYKDKMNTAAPWNEYPRQRLIRNSFMSLNGEWDFAVAGKDIPEVFDEKILVPFPPESALSGICREIKRGKRLYYKRSFTLPDGFLRDRLILHFGAVDQIAEVYLNGEFVICHEGGYLPFCADITDLICEGENTVLVKVTDDLSHDYPYGKQRRRRGGMWYTPVSGIWQTVWLESVPKSYIEEIKITSNMHFATIKILGGEDKKRLTLKDGKVYEFTGEEITIEPDVITLWSPDTPYIYDFTLESGEDSVKSYFALREIGVKEVNGIPRLTLNGKPYLFNGLLDQGYFPDGIYLPATSDGYRDDILLAKRLGFNTLRKHIKVEPDIFYTLCDRLGMIVFQDMVNNSGYSFIFDTALPTIGMKRFPDRLLHRKKRSREIFKKHMIDEILYLDSHPSVLYYTLFNEGWGQFRADEMYAWAKAAAPDKIIDSTSGWFWQSNSDVDSRHVYFKPIKVDAPPTRPLVISEFGGYSHRVKGHLFGDANYGYSVCKTPVELYLAIEKLYLVEVKEAIEKGASGFIYTELSDIEDETNGFVTYDRRKVKLDTTKAKAMMDELSAIVDELSVD